MVTVTVNFNYTHKTPIGETIMSSKAGNQSPFAHFDSFIFKNTLQSLSQLIPKYILMHNLKFSVRKLRITEASQHEIK